MTSFKDTNAFINFMQNTPASVDSGVDTSIPDEQVGSLRPLTSSVTQEATGYSGADFKPNPNRPKEENPHIPKSLTTDYNFVLDPSGDDYVPGAEAKKRMTIREKLVQDTKKKILSEYADQNARYDRAVDYVNSMSAKEFDKLSTEDQSKLEKALKVVERGIPMSEEAAEIAARKQASTQIIRVER